MMATNFSLVLGLTSVEGIQDGGADQSSNGPWRCLQQGFHIKAHLPPESQGPEVWNLMRMGKGAENQAVEATMWRRVGGVWLRVTQTHGELCKLSRLHGVVYSDWHRVGNRKLWRQLWWLLWRLWVLGSGLGLVPVSPSMGLAWRFEMHRFKFEAA